ncbi:Scr1 family TA system antitoxin-like transcriptional regulator [Streptomyces syringium]|uniref:Scr1 family TA system antitoxin-like transcriptional regulator n=1 Tax=Streptomyces syringium TaxID=76729 RepID=UPI0037D221CC
MTRHQPAADVLEQEADQPTPPPQPRQAPYLVVGSYLRALRRGQGRTQQEAARVLGCNPTKIHRMEAGACLREDDVLALLRLYQVEDAGVEKAVRHLLVNFLLSPHLIYDAGQGWTDRLAALEPRATAERIFTATMIPPVLQTPEYAAVRRRTPWACDPAVRLSDGALGPRIHRETTVLLDELLLERPVGGPAVMAGQLAHLQQVAERGEIRILLASCRFLVPHRYVSELTIKDERLCVWRNPGSVLYSSGPNAQTVSHTIDAACDAADSPERSSYRIGLAREHFTRVAAAP